GVPDPFVRPSATYSESGPDGAVAESSPDSEPTKRAVSPFRLRPGATDGDEVCADLGRSESVGPSGPPALRLPGERLRSLGTQGVTLARSAGRTAAAPAGRDA